LGWALTHCASIFLGEGERSKAEAIWTEVEVLAQRTRDPYVVLQPLTNEIIRQTLNGDAEAAVRSADELIMLGEQGGSDVVGGEAGRMHGLRPRIYLGRHDEGLMVAQRLQPTLAGRSKLATALAMVGHKEEARHEIRELLKELERGEGYNATAVSLLESAVIVEDRASLAHLLPMLSPVRRIIRTRARDLTCIARHLGAASALLGRPDEARAFYNDAIEVCTKVRFRPELALTRLQLAELLLAHYPDERPGAIEHLDFAIAEFREMKMQPSLERALRHRELLKA
jgi:hypothetical protein